MQGQINPKIVGATVIGFALVGAAYTISSLNTPKTITQPAAVSANTPQRVAIAVTDADNNGLEDWRDEFVTTKPIILSEANSAEYTPPDTITGKMSIQLFEDIVRAKNYGPFGKTKDEVIKHTVNNLAEETNITLYDTPAIDIMTDWNDEDVRNYANTVAAVLIQNSAPGTENELDILYDVVTNKNLERVSELQKISTVYKNYRDDTLKIPVPAFLAKQHLDLINTYHAIYQDVTAMSEALNDPAVALLRLKRYQDDASGLALAMENMFESLAPYAKLIQKDDPAAIFVVFSSDFQR